MVSQLDCVLTASVRSESAPEEQHEVHALLGEESEQDGKGNEDSCKEPDADRFCTVNTLDLASDYSGSNHLRWPWMK